MGRNIDNSRGFHGVDIHRFAKKFGHSLPRTKGDSVKTVLWEIESTAHHLSTKETFYREQRNQRFAQQAAQEITQVMVEIDQLMHS